MHVCLCVHTHAHIYMCMYMNLFAYVCVSACRLVCLSTCINVFVTQNDPSLMLLMLLLRAPDTLHQNEASVDLDDYEVSSYLVSPASAFQNPLPQE